MLRVQEKGGRLTPISKESTHAPRKQKWEGVKKGEGKRNA